MSADVSQLMALAADLQVGGREVNTAVRKTTQESTKAVERHARDLAPERTGELKREIKALPVRGNVGVVRSFSRQGFFQEHGTSVMAPQPHMVPALEAEAPIYAKNLESSATDAVAKAVGA